LRIIGRIRATLLLNQHSPIILWLRLFLLSHVFGRYNGAYKMYMNRV